MLIPLRVLSASKVNFTLLVIQVSVTASSALFMVSLAASIIGCAASADVSKNRPSQLQTQGRGGQSGVGNVLDRLFHGQCSCIDKMNATVTGCGYTSTTAGGMPAF
jgi:long-subunit fatty acid transport protein